MLTPYPTRRASACDRPGLPGGGGAAHFRAFRLIAVAAGAKHEDQSSAGMRAQRIERRRDGVGGVGIVDIDGRAGAGDRGAFESPAHRLETSEIARSEEHTSELQSLMRISYAVFCLKKKTKYLTHRYLLSFIITHSI